MKTRILTAALLVCALVIALLVPVTAQSPVSEFDTILLERLIATDSVTVPDLTASGTTTVGTLNVTGNAALSTFTTTGNSNVGGTLSVDDRLALSTGYSLVPGTPISVTSALVITPTSSFQLLEASGNVSSGEISNSCASGQVVTLMNTSNVTITIPDSGDNNLSAAGALGQWDTLTVVCYAVTDWYEIGRSNN